MVVIDHKRRNPALGEPALGYHASSRYRNEYRVRDSPVRHQTTIRTSPSKRNGTRKASCDNTRGDLGGSINDSLSRGPLLPAVVASNIAQEEALCLCHGNVIESANTPLSPSSNQGLDRDASIESANDSSKSMEICMDESRNHDTNSPSSDQDDESNDSGGSGSEDESTSSDTASDSSLVSPVIGSSQRQAIDGLMAEFKTILNQTFGFRSRPTSTETSNGSPVPDQQSGTRESGGGSKRKDTDKRGFGSHEGEGSGGGAPAENSELGALGPIASSRKLACPYFRRDPLRHKKHRSCAGPGWITVHRVK